jgi:uncharacterized membrane protein YdfJ with MMPL/SSD domain
MDTTETRAPARPPRGLDDRPPIGVPTAVPPAPGRIGRGASRCAGWATRRPWFVIGAWLFAIALLVGLGTSAGTRTLSDASSGVGSSRQADLRLDAAGLTPPASENVLLTSAHAPLTSTAAADLGRRLDGAPDVGTVTSGLSASALRTDDGRTLLVTVTLRGSPDSDTSYLGVAHAVAATAAEYPGVRLQEAGTGSGDAAVSAVLAHDLHRAELVSLPITLAVLLLAFGALVAASVPLLLGLTAVAGALGALGLVSHLVPMSTSASTLVVLIGLAVGVDYSLFFIRRERVERRAGRTPEAALAAAIAATGRAVVVAGSTVMVAMAGLFITGMTVFASIAVATILVVAIAVVGSVTVLPAVLVLLGDRIDAGRPARLLGRRAHRPAGRRWAFWARAGAGVCRRPLLSLTVAVVLLGVLAAPALNLRTSGSTATDLPASVPIVAAENAIEQAFPGAPSDALLVVSGTHLSSATARSGLAALGAQAAALTRGTGPTTIAVSADGRTAVVGVPMPDTSDAAAGAVVAGLRSQVAARAGVVIGGATAQVSGAAAEAGDFTHRLDVTTPIVVGFVLAVAFALLVVTFGSSLLALAVIALDLLSVGVAYGVLSAVFQHSWAQSLLGFTSDGAVVNWVPLFAFVILFGLSMDYTVIVLERIREARRDGLSPRAAAAAGVAATGGTVTSAAVVMIAVFSIFAGLRLVEFKEIGVGLAAAVAVDATLVRGVALPAVVSLIGRRWRVLPGRVAEAQVAESQSVSEWDSTQLAGGGR